MKEIFGLFDGDILHSRVEPQESSRDGQMFAKPSHEQINPCRFGLRNAQPGFATRRFAALLNQLRKSGLNQDLVAQSGRRSIATEQVAVGRDGNPAGRPEQVGDGLPLQLPVLKHESATGVQQAEAGL
jgi:hypothetical protein